MSRIIEVCASLNQRADAIMYSVEMFSVMGTESGAIC